MKYIKIYEEYSDLVDIKRSEVNKIVSLPGYDLYRRDILGHYCVIGRREQLALEDLTIKKKIDGSFILDIRRAPGFFKGLITFGQKGWEEDWSKREFNLTFNFDDIDGLIKFLTEYDGWYDLNH
jgi:hypothetical protein